MSANKMNDPDSNDVKNDDDIKNVLVNNVKMTNKVNIYHEKQSRQLCALHALNNLFQNSNAFTKNDLDSIAETLSPSSLILFNPHKSTFGFGNYDVNVILMALQNKNYEAVWFNKKKDPKQLNLNVIFGFILNIPNDCDFWKNALTFFTSSRRHWIAVRKFDSQYYNLDSKLKEPITIGQEENLFNFLQTNLTEKNAEVFVIVTKEIAQQNNWYNEMTNDHHH
ncbi:josephin domain containing [Dermatophagoides farinae]|uniref:ubiquitinyl hydrolase 1 n=1 Tax=Dermatophagoides farinae TaxID=6954 RepID=A0A922L0A9_DERFA|nr:josephin-1-like [Dermatophagoides farinae]KAH7643765.1 josephin-1-like protein [Dermatophagoides farinae]KAH9497252.1 Josephin-1 [Dermatophagoides farinae]